MGKRLAISIAVENYADARIKPVKYAESDANGFAAALELGGALDKVFLLSSRATKTTINSQVRQHLKALTATDELYLFYAGHGFSKNGHNFITCHDTDIDDLEDTSINLKELLDTCGKSACKRIAVFLDSCESGITDLPEVRGIYATMSATELEEFFQAAEYRTCFASCKTSESSYSSDKLKHGVWTHHVIEALEGNARPALEGHRYVTAGSLQNYLHGNPKNPAEGFQQTHGSNPVGLRQPKSRLHHNGSERCSETEIGCQARLRSGQKSVPSVGKVDANCFAQRLYQKVPSSSG
jgi:hypothetical protein